MKFSVLSRITSSTVSMLYLMFGIGWGGSGPRRNFLLADLAPARLDCGVVDVSRPLCSRLRGPTLSFEICRIVGVTWIFHGVQVVQVPAEFIEAVHGRQKFVQVSQVIFAELAGGVTHGLEAVAMVGASSASQWGSGLPTVVSPVRIGNSPVMKLARPAVQLASA